MDTHSLFNWGCWEYSPEISWHVELSPLQTPQISVAAVELMRESQPTLWNGNKKPKNFRSATRAPRKGKQYKESCEIISRGELSPLDQRKSEFRFFFMSECIRRYFYFYVCLLPLLSFPLSPLSPNTRKDGCVRVGVGVGVVDEGR